MGDDNDVDDSEERRSLRKGQRDIGNKILDNLEELCRPGSKLYEEYRETVNTQFAGTKHSREQLLDAENLKIMSYAAKTQASKINTMSVYNYNTFADAIRHQMLDSETLGMHTTLTHSRTYMLS